MLLHRDRSLLLAVDIQERLLPAIYEGDRVLANTLKLVQAARQLAIPVLCSEQYPKGLGATVPDLRAVLDDGEILKKVHFSCAEDSGIAAAIAALRRRQVVICGVESHVCVLQSAIGLKKAGFDPAVVLDAVSNRASDSVAAAVGRLSLAGILLVTVEMALFEWLGQAATPEFRDLRGLIA